MAIDKSLAEKIKNHPGFLAFWGRNVKTDTSSKKKKEADQGGAKR